MSEITREQQAILSLNESLLALTLIVQKLSAVVDGLVDDSVKPHCCIHCPKASNQAQALALYDENIIDKAEFLRLVRPIKPLGVEP